MLSPPQPCPAVIQDYLKRWEEEKELQKYRDQEISLNFLFESLPGNHDLKNVLSKTSALNDFYSTHLRNTYSMAKHIVSLKNVDRRLRDGDITLIDDIADTQLENGKKRHCFSFATKYCSRYFPTKFPIYDVNVKNMLLHYRGVDQFFKFTNDNLRISGPFKEIVTKFITFYKLNDFSFKQLDMFLWLCGKQFFPRSKT